MRTIVNSSYVTLDGVIQKPLCIWDLPHCAPTILPMDTQLTHPPADRRHGSLRTAVRHFVEMVVAMLLRRDEYTRDHKRQSRRRNHPR